MPPTQLDFENLRSHILLGSLSTESFDLIKPLINIKELKKNDYFLKQGQTPSEIGFILSGLTRLFSTSEEGKEHTKDFMAEGQFIGGLPSLIVPGPSRFSIQTLGQAKLIVISYVNLILLAENNLEWANILRKFMELKYLEKEEREYRFLNYNAKKYYTAFEKDFSHLMHRIPKYHIASYLGITPPALSRLMHKS